MLLPEGLHSAGTSEDQLSHMLSLGGSTSGFGEILRIARLEEAKLGMMSASPREAKGRKHGRFSRITNPGPQPLPESSAPGRNSAPT